MLEAIRRRKRIAQLILLILIIPFAFFGIEHYFSSGPARHEVATVGSAPITVTALREALEQQSERMRSQSGAAFDPRLVKSQPFVEGVLRQLIERQLLVNETERLGIVVGTEAVQQAITGVAAFQKDGVFDYATYERVLRAQGMTPNRFEALVAQDLAIERLVDAVQGSVVTPQTARTLLAWEEERRSLRWLVQSIAERAATIPIDDGALAAYFAEHTAQYQQGEQVQLAYVVLDPARVTASEAASSQGEGDKAAKGRRFQELAAQLPELAFQAVDRLEPVAEAVGGTVETTDLLPLAALRLNDGTPLPAELRSAITSEAGQRGENLEPVTLADGRMVVVRVVRFEPARQRGLEEVRAEVEQDWRRNEARVRLRRELEEVAKGDTLSWSSSGQVARLTSDLPAAVVRAAFAAEVGKRQVVETEDAVWLIEVTAVEPAKVSTDDPRLPDLTELLTQRYASLSYRAWLTALQERYPVTVRREALKPFTE